MVSYKWSFKVCIWKLTVCQKLGERHRHGLRLHGSYRLEEKMIINQITRVVSMIKGEEKGAWDIDPSVLQWGVVRWLPCRSEVYAQKPRMGRPEIRGEGSGC